MKSQKKDIIHGSLFVGVTHSDQLRHQAEPLPYATNQYSQPLECEHKAYCINCTIHVLLDIKFYDCFFQCALVTYFPYSTGGYS